MTTTCELTNTQNSIIKTILYFDVFNYPLTSDEIFDNVAVSFSKSNFEYELKQIITLGYINNTGHFYSTQPNIAQNIERRLAANKLANNMLPIAVEKSKRIFNFPFVSAICISGSLSKSYFDEKSDLDFFIVTKPNRLWICRSLYIIFYKLLPRKQKKLYCLNYFISEADMAINDKNLFVATELAYLIPTTGYNTYCNLLATNNWYKTFFANKPIASNKLNTDYDETRKKKIVERFFYGSFGNTIDSLLLKITLTHWRKKYKNMADEDFELQFRSRKHVCKRHTHGYQNKVLELWQNKLTHFELQHKLSLN